MVVSLSGGFVGTAAWLVGGGDCGDAVVVVTVLKNAATTFGGRLNVEGIALTLGNMNVSRQASALPAGIFFKMEICDFSIATFSRETLPGSHHPEHRRHGVSNKKHGTLLRQASDPPMPRPSPISSNNGRLLRRPSSFQYPKKRYRASAEKEAEKDFKNASVPELETEAQVRPPKPFQHTDKPETHRNKHRSP